MRKHFSVPRYFFLVNAGQIAIAFFVLFNSACNKKSETKAMQDELITKKEEQNKDQIAARGGITPNSVPLYCEDLENPCSDPACQPYYNCEPETPTITITSVQNSNVQNDVVTAFQTLNVNLSQLSSELGLSYTLSSSNIDFQNISRSYVTNDDGIGEAFVAPFKNNSSSSPINYAFCITVDADSIYKPYIIKTTTNQSLKYFDLNEGYILTINNYNNQNTLSFQNTMGNYLNTAARAYGCGQATMDCFIDAYSNHGWASLWATVQSIFIPHTGLAIAGACAVKNCIPRRIRS